MISGSEYSLLGYFWGQKTGVREPDRVSGPRDMLTKGTVCEATDHPKSLMLAKEPSLCFIPSSGKMPVKCLGLEAKFLNSAR